MTGPSTRTSGTGDLVDRFKARMAAECDRDAAAGARQAVHDAAAEVREIQAELQAIQSPRVWGRRGGRRLSSGSWGQLELQKRLNVAVAREEAARASYQRALDDQSGQ